MAFPSSSSTSTVITGVSQVPPLSEMRWNRLRLPRPRNLQRNHPHSEQNLICDHEISAICTSSSSSSAALDRCCPSAALYLATFAKFDQANLMCAFRSLTADGAGADLAVFALPKKTSTEAACIKLSCPDTCQVHSVRSREAITEQCHQPCRLALPLGKTPQLTEQRCLSRLVSTFTE